MSMPRVPAGPSRECVPGYSDAQTLGSGITTSPAAPPAQRLFGVSDTMGLSRYEEVLRFSAAT